MKDENTPMSFRPSPELRKKIIASADKNTRAPAHEIMHILINYFKGVGHDKRRN